MMKLNHASSKSGGLIVCAVLLLIVVNFSSAALSDTYKLSEGDMVAIQLNFYSLSKWQTFIEQYDVPFHAYYDRTDDKVVIQVYGTEDRIDAAKDMIDRVRNLLDNDFIPYLKNNQEIDLKPNNDVRIVYRNRIEEGFMKILIWEHGKFRFPINK